MPDHGQLYFNGIIRTMDTVFPTAKAVAVKDGRITAVGEKGFCAEALGKNYEPVDLKGRTLLPGFIDTHLHPVMVIYFSINCDLGKASSMSQLKEELRAALSQKNDDSWLIGLNFDEQNLQEKKIPSRHDLDDVCKDRPVIIIKHDGHSVFANTRAIEVAGITASTPDPESGTIEREADGYPSGAFRETAGQLVMKVMPMPELPALIEGARNTFRRLASLGLTSLGVVLQTGEEGPAGSVGAFDTMAMQLFSEHCPQSLYSLLITADISSLDELRNTALSTSPNRLGGVKLFADGTFGSSTASMLAPFSDDTSKQGQLMHPPEELYRRMAAAHNAGWQVCIHAIGDSANRLCAELYGRLFKEFPREGCRHRVEHASILDGWTIQEFSRFGIVVSTQPMFIHSEKEWLPRRLGFERCSIVYPFRTLLDTGIKVSGASDGPVESQDVLQAIQCCVTREGFEPHQCITVEEALRMYTIEAAYAQFDEDTKGSITPGKRADMVILNADPFKTDPNKIKDIRVEKTLVAGETIYPATSE
jgi:predicted amidohydrolase YtcJ